MPVELLQREGIQGVSAGWGNSCAISDAGYVSCWGINTSGQSRVPVITANQQSLIVVTGNGYNCVQ